VAFRLIPREEPFFDAFVALSEQIRNGAMLLEEMLAPDRVIWTKATEIKAVEHICDGLTRDVIQRLNRTFITPLDREDIHRLARSLDDVMDAIDASAAVLRLHRIEQVRPEARELAAILKASVDQVGIGLKALENRTNLVTCAVEINRLENHADRVHQAAVGALFADERNPIAIIKWKEILDFLEDATDRCEDVADIFEGVIVKYM
jgi:predicted phosphate transport protein (TIGR00153 family)